MFAKLIALILMVCAAVSSFGQDITGLADFRTGMSVDEFLNVSTIKEKNIKDKALRTYKTEIGDLWKTSIDSQWSKSKPLGNGPSNPALDKIAKSVLISNQVYSGDIVKFEFKSPLGIPNLIGEDLYDISIMFYKDKLSRIHVSNASMDFEKILTSKYGQPIKEDTSKQITCQNGYGAKTTHTEGSSISTWGKGKKITGVYRLTMYGCGKNVLVSYTVEDEAGAKIIEKIQTDGKKEALAEDEKSAVGASKL